MARLWPSVAGTDYLTIPVSATLWAFNTDICLLAIVRPSVLEAGRNVVALGTSADTRGFSMSMSGTGGLWRQVSAGIGNVPGTVTTAVVAGEWAALGLGWSSGGDRAFKRYRYATSTLDTEVVTSTQVTNAPLASDDRNLIGAFLTLASSGMWKGDIDRVLIAQGTMPSDAAFTAWARAGTVPPSLTVKGYWILSPLGTAASPEEDLGPNNVDLTTITGTTASAAFVLPDTVQTARPSADTFVSGWEEQDGTTDALYARLNEDPANDTNYIRTGLSPSTAIYVTKLTSLPEPPDDTNHTLKLRLGKDPVGGQTINVTVQLRTGYVNEGSPGALVTEEVYSNVAGGFTEVSIPLLTTEADDLDTAEYLNSLFVRIVAHAP